MSDLYIVAIILYGYCVFSSFISYFERSLKSAGQLLASISQEACKSKQIWKVPISFDYMSGVTETENFSAIFVANSSQRVSS